MKRIKNKIMFPVYVMAILFIGFMTVQIGMVFRNLNQVRDMERIYFATTIKSADLKLSVVQVQQWLTDISATRAAEGFDDGFEEAENHALNIKSIIAQLKEINPANQKELDEILSSFDPYYETGKKMAEAYISLGPDGGNQMMGDFDTTAEAINSKVDAFVSKSNTDIEAAIIAVENSITISVVLAALAVIASLIICIFIRISIGRNVVRPIDEVRNAARDLAKGDLSSQISYQSDDETGQMADDMRKTTATLNKYISEIIRCTDEMGHGNLTETPKIAFQGDFIKLQNSIVHLAKALNDTLTQIHQFAEEVTNGSEQVSFGAQSLSQGTTEQSNAIGQLAAAINKISTQIEDISHSAAHADQRMNTVKAETTESNRRMQQMQNAMSDISQSSDKIGKIIKTIEDIAFQTNILALNAAVEAARAGEAGKGFAVVAEEVRNLANKSQEASKNTSVLIEDSIRAVENGTKAADETAQSFLAVAEGIEEIARNIDEISISTSMQSSSLAQVSHGIDQISNVIQTNSSTAEESASASEELSDHAQMLKNMIGQFRLSDPHSSSPILTEKPVMIDMDKY